MGWTRQLLAISTRFLSVALDPDALLDKAQRQTGLSNFGSAAFHKPFEILLQSLREEARLSAVFGEVEFLEESLLFCLLYWERGNLVLFCDYCHFVRIRFLGWTS